MRSLVREKVILDFSTFEVFGIEIDFASFTSLLDLVLNVNCEQSEQKDHIHIDIKWPMSLWNRVKPDKYSKILLQSYNPEFGFV